MPQLLMKSGTKAAALQKYHIQVIQICGCRQALEGSIYEMMRSIVIFFRSDHFDRHNPTLAEIFEKFA